MPGMLATFRCHGVDATDQHPSIGPPLSAVPKDSLWPGCHAGGCGAETTPARSKTEAASSANGIGTAGAIRAGCCPGDRFKLAGMPRHAQLGRGGERIVFCLKFAGYPVYPSMAFVAAASRLPPIWNTE